MSIGKFYVGKWQKRCGAAKKKKKLCNREEFFVNCPNTCGKCDSGCASLIVGDNGDDNSGGGDNEEGGNEEGGNDGGGNDGGGNDGGDNGDTGSTECSGGAPNCCMGLTNTCDMKVDELFYAAMHNANNDEDKWNSNHEGSLEKALEAGFRSFYLDVCYCRGKVVFCHGTCFFAGQQDPSEIFRNVVSFLDENPSEIVFFNFEISFNKPTPQMLWNVMKQVDGFEEKSYVHNGGNNWPTIGNLLGKGKQIISLKHNGDNCLDTSNSGCTPYIQEWFKYVVGTKYTFRDVGEVEDINNSCTGYRGTAYKQLFYAINNFVTLDQLPGPSAEDAAVINTDSFVQQRIKDCEKVMNKNANFFAIDFWQVGNLGDIALKINKERADKRMGL